MTNTIYSTKECSKCKIEKSINEFGENKHNKDGFDGKCKSCKYLYNKEYTRKNKSKVVSYQKDYYNIHQKKVKNKSKEYAFNNKTKIKQYQIEYRIRNKEQLSKYIKNYLIDYRKNVNIRLHRTISSCLYKSIKKEYKTSKYLKQFGYTVEELKSHLESKFVDGMTWGNYGEWHLDHIKPKSWFDCSNEKQLIECWSLSNLQPLWAKDNLSKGNRFIG